jgi:hypothetical protein
VRALRVDAIADSGRTYGGRAFSDGMREAVAHHVPVHARGGDRWATDDGVTLSVLSPCGALFADGKNDVDENSVVVMPAYRNFPMLLMGDAGFAAEQRLLESGDDLHAPFTRASPSSASAGSICSDTPPQRHLRHCETPERRRSAQILCGSAAVKWERTSVSRRFCAAQPAMLICRPPLTETVSAVCRWLICNKRRAVAMINLRRRSASARRPAAS